jgi:uncharacterized protein (DUF2062 family)
VIEKLKNYVRKGLHTLTGIPHSPHFIAKSYAVGAFIGIMPAIGLPVVLLAAYVFRLSKVAAILGGFVSNPWTAPFIYAASYKMGRWIYKSERVIEWKRLMSFDEGWPQEFYHVAAPLFTGAAIIGLIVAGISYVVVRLVVARYAAVRKHEHFHWKEYRPAVDAAHAADLIERFLENRLRYPQEWNDFVASREENATVEPYRKRCERLDPLVNRPEAPRDPGALSELKLIVAELRSEPSPSH